MADVGAPSTTAQEQWPNRKEDYELLDVIGQCLKTMPLGPTFCGVLCHLFSDRQLVWL